MKTIRVNRPNGLWYDLTEGDNGNYYIGLISGEFYNMPQPRIFTLYSSRDKKGFELLRNKIIKKAVQ